MDWESALPGTSVINRAIAGETVHGALGRVQSIIETGARTAVLMIGINDLNKREPVDQIFDDYKRLVEALRSAGMRVIVFPCLTGSDRVIGATRALNDKVRELCARSVCEYHELDELLGQDGLLRPENTYDNTHLTVRLPTLGRVRFGCVGRKTIARTAPPVVAISQGDAGSLDRLELHAGSTDLPPHQDAVASRAIKGQVEFRGQRDIVGCNRPAPAGEKSRTVHRTRECPLRRIVPSAPTRNRCRGGLSSRQVLRPARSSRWRRYRGSLCGCGESRR